MIAWSLDAIAGAGIPRAVVAVPPGTARPPRTRSAPTRRPSRSGSRSSRAARPARSPSATRLPLPVTRSPSSSTTRRGRSPRRSCSPPRWRRSPEPTPRSRRPGATDTIKEAGADGIVVRTLERDRLWAIQTPQAFRAAVLHRALEAGADVLAQATDDAWLVERAGGTVRVVESSPANFKVTTPHDLRVADSLLC